MQNSQISDDLREIFESVKKLVSNNSMDFRPRSAQAKVSDESLLGAVLSVLASGAKNLNQISQALAIASAQTITASSGSIAQALDKAQEHGFVSFELDEDRKVYSLTEAGVAEVENLLTKKDSEADHESSQSEGQPAHSQNILAAAAKLANAVSGVAQSGTRDQKARATELVEQTTRQIYRILAEN